MNDIWPTTHGGPLDQAAQTDKTAHSAYAASDETRSRPLAQQLPSSNFWRSG
jgi:hypothetical protein